MRVSLRLLSTSTGGRTTPITSDYRPHWDAGAKWDGAPVYSDARVSVGDDGCDLAPRFPLAAAHDHLASPSP